MLTYGPPGRKPHRKQTTRCMRSATIAPTEKQKPASNHKERLLGHWTTIAGNSRGLRACLLGRERDRALRAALLLRSLRRSGHLSLRDPELERSPRRRPDRVLWWGRLVLADLRRRVGRPLRLPSLAGLRLSGPCVGLLPARVARGVVDGAAPRPDSARSAGAAHPRRSRSRPSHRQTVH